MRLGAILLLSLCSACNALTGASELELVSCTIGCDSSVAGDTIAEASVEDTGADTTSVVPETGEPPDTTGSDTEVDSAPIDSGSDTGTADTAIRCTNGVADEPESDVDCGGGVCPKCAVSRVCRADADCESDRCVSGRCAACPVGMAVINVLMTRYCIDIHETTNAEYRAFLEKASIAGQPSYCGWNMTFTPSSLWPPALGRESHPVRYVDWCDANAYCRFRGKRLCGRIGGGAAMFDSYANSSINEWFRACSVGGTRTYPYGSMLDEDYCNSRGAGYLTTVAVGSLTSCTSPFATFDMSGNVSEWEDLCAGAAGASDACRVRGGSYLTLDPKCSLSEVYARNATNEHVGIRCCDD